MTNSFLGLSYWSAMFFLCLFLTAFLLQASSCVAYLRVRSRYPCLTNSRLQVVSRVHLQKLNTPQEVYNSALHPVRTSCREGVLSKILSIVSTTYGNQLWNIPPWVNLRIQILCLGKRTWKSHIEEELLFSKESKKQCVSPDTLFAKNINCWLAEGYTMVTSASVYSSNTSPLVDGSVGAFQEVF